MSGIVIVAVGVYIFSVISAYIYGRESGAERESVKSRMAFIATLKTMGDAHKEAGVTKAQAKKINEYLSKEILADVEAYGK